MRARGKLGRTRAPSVSVRANANLAQIFGTRRTRSFECVAPLERALMTRQSDRTSSDACERYALARWRCPYTSTEKLDA
jgi:hypothetical protein